MKPKAIAAALVGVAVASGCASQSVNTEREIFERVSKSLSPFEFGKRDFSAVLRLRQSGDLPCEADFWSRCSLVDRHGVEHSLYDGRLVVKLVQIRDVRQVEALSIGNARSKPDVVKAVNEFASPKSLTCLGNIEDECFIEFDSANLRLRFDRSGGLISIRLDDWVTP